MEESEFCRLTKNLDYLNMSDTELRATRKLNRDRIKVLETRHPVRFRETMQELQNVREVYEDGVMLLKCLKSPQVLRPLELFLEGLQKLVLLQESLFATVEDVDELLPDQVMKQELMETNLQLSHQQSASECDIQLYKDKSRRSTFLNHHKSEDHADPVAEECKNERLDDQDDCDDDEVNLSPKEEHSTTSEFSTENIKLESSDIYQDKTSEQIEVKPKKKRKRKRGNPISCEECDQILATPSMYLIHMRRHTGEKPFKCDQCFKGFSTKGILKEHAKVHSGDKPYQCNVCAKRFLLKSGLVRHMFTHSDDKPFKCEFCYQGCTTSGNLIRHRRIHTGEKPYVCDVCNKAFADSNMLTEHKRIHTGEKPFHCDVCNNSFSRKDHLRRHQRLHSGIKPYQCQLCEKFFTRRSNLKEHMNTHNRIKTE